MEATAGYVKEDGCRVTTFKECSEDTFGPEVTPFTTRDDSIRRARERRVPNEEEEEGGDDASAALPMLSEALYGAMRPKFASTHRPNGCRSRHRVYPAHQAHRWWIFRDDLI